MDMAAVCLGVTAILHTQAVDEIHGCTFILHPIRVIERIHS
jgi:hypothetical protein